MNTRKLVYSALFSALTAVGETVAADAAYHPRGGDQTQQEAEGGLEHIAEAAAHGEDGQAHQT